MDVVVKPSFIDLVFLILCLRIVYIAVARGMLRECFRLLGLINGVFAAFHNYTGFSEKLVKIIPFLNREYVHFISFFLIFIGVNAVFTLLRLIITFLFKREQISLKERWVSFLFGSAGACFWVSAVIFALHLSPLNPKHFTSSISYALFKNIAPKAYLVSMNLNPKIGANEKVQKYCELKNGGRE